MLCHKLKIGYAALTVVLCLVLCGAVWGDEFRLTPSITLKEKYNDNVFYTTDNRKSDWITIVSPGLELIEKTEKIDAALSARLDGLYYKDENDLRSVDQFYKGRLHYMLTRYFGVGMEAGYLRDSQPDRELEATGLGLTTVKRDRQNYGLSGDWVISDKTLAMVSYKYAKDHYNSDSYLDLESHSVGINLQYAINASLKGFLNMGFDNFRVPGTTVDSYTGTVGLSRDFSELWNIAIAAGPLFSRTRYTTYLLTEDTRDSWGWVGQASVGYKGEKASGNFAIARSLSAASGRTGAVNRTSLNLDCSYRLFYELRAVVSAYYFLNKSGAGEYSSQAIDEKTVQVSPGLRYEFNRDMSLEGNYIYTRTNYRVTDTSADRHMVMISFNLKHALME